MKTLLLTTILLVSFAAKAETYFVDFQVSTNEADVVSVKIDEKGEGFREFENELDLGGGEKIKAGFLKVRSFTAEGNNTVNFTITVGRNSVTYKTVKNIENCPVVTNRETEIPVNIGYNTWVVLKDISERSESRVRVRKTS